MQRALTKHTRALFYEKQILSLRAVLPGSAAVTSGGPMICCVGASWGSKNRKPRNPEPGLRGFLRSMRFFTYFS